MQSAGIEEQKRAKKFLRIIKPVEVRNGDKWARFDPFEGLKLASRLTSTILYLLIQISKRA